MDKRPVVLLILDGFGISFEKRGNPVAAAKIPNLKYISENYPGTTLRASGIEVGLSWGEMGSSEVGHANIGAGLVVYQNLSKINLAIKSKEFFKLPAWGKAVNHAVKNNSAIHLLGIISSGGVHSHIDHLIAILRAIKDLKFKGKVFIQAFADGQDAPPQSALKFINALEAELRRLEIGKIASISGRYYGLDKGDNWDRVKKSYDCLIEGIGNKSLTAEKAISESYGKGIKDEQIEPTVITEENGEPVGLLKDNDALIFFHFRADRARELTQAFIFENFNKFKRRKLKNLLFIPLTQYGLDYPLEPAFPLQNIKEPLAKVISDAGKQQFHIAEKEKYAHVTYFFNGGAEKEFPGEDRIIIPSKNAQSYELIPEMSAYEITKELTVKIKSGKYDFLVANLANGDIVGHTGNFKAGIKAVETLDDCIGKIMKETLENAGTLIITADHGNVEEMINLETGEIDKEHSTNPVPLWIISPENKKPTGKRSENQIAPEGILADVAPTILDIMKIPKPEEMTGASLLNLISNCLIQE